MYLKDVIYLIIIVGITSFLLYRLVPKKKGGCGGCSDSGCGSRCVTSSLEKSALH
jgi:hypothetical protein